MVKGKKASLLEAMKSELGWEPTLKMSDTVPPFRWAARSEEDHVAHGARGCEVHRV